MKDMHSVYIYRCGPRSGRDAQKKRKAMEKKLNTEEQKDG